MVNSYDLGILGRSPERSQSARSHSCVPSTNLMIRPRANSASVPWPSEQPETLHVPQSANSGLWRSAPFQKDLQRCLLPQRDQSLLLSSGTGEKVKGSSRNELLDVEPQEVLWNVRGFWADETMSWEVKQLQRVSVRACKPLSVQDMKPRVVHRRNRRPAGCGWFQERANEPPGVPRNRCHFLFTSFFLSFYQCLHIGGPQHLCRTT